MVHTGVKLPIDAYNGAFIAYNKGPVAQRVFMHWNKVWNEMGRNREMPALACVMKLENPKIKVVPTGYFEAFDESERAIVQHHFATGFLKKFNLPKYKPRKAHTKKTDFRFTEIV